MEDLWIKAWENWSREREREVGGEERECVWKFDGLRDRVAPFFQRLGRGLRIQRDLVVGDAPAEKR